MLGCVRWHFLTYILARDLQLYLGIACTYVHTYVHVTQQCVIFRLYYMNKYIYEKVHPLRIIIIVMYVL